MYLNKYDMTIDHRRVSAMDLYFHQMFRRMFNNVDKRGTIINNEMGNLPLRELKAGLEVLTKEHKGVKWELQVGYRKGVYNVIAEDGEAKYVRLNKNDDS